MKKMVNRALVTLALIATPMLAHAEKIAVVDMGEVFEQLPQREQISKALKAEFGDRVAEVQKMQEEMPSEPPAQAPPVSTIERRPTQDELMGYHDDEDEYDDMPDEEFY